MVPSQSRRAVHAAMAVAWRLGLAVDEPVVLDDSDRLVVRLLPADIVVLDGSGIAETGSHDELMLKGGLYAELFDLQARSYR